MEANKENINRLKVRTKIPVPVQPLPEIPKRLLQTKNESFTTQQRIPLRTITSDNQAGPSHNRDNVIQNNLIPLKVNAKFVTLRQGNGDLDWNYKVFKDEYKENKISTISDSEKNKKITEVVEQIKNIPVVEKREVTPVPISPPEPARVKHIKRSLKRPHSRELQGLSPLVEKKKEEERYKRRLQFNEGIQDILQSPNYSKKLYAKCIETDYAEDLFSYLLSLEKPGVTPVVSSISRACIINWIMKINGVHGNPAVVQTALWYLDSVLNVSSVPTDKLQLVASACYWIAQKIYGPSLTASVLVKYSNRAFSCNRLIATEKAILNKLNFPTQPVVPQDFISYLSWWSDSTLSSEIEIAATFLCMCGMLVNKNLCTELPSVIAATSVHNALLVLKKRDLVQHLQDCPVYRAISKKVENICSLCIKLRRAVHIVADPTYEYKAPLQHFGMAPHHIAEKVVNYVNMSQLFDTPRMK